MTRWLAHSQITYLGLRPVLDLLFRKDESPAFRIWVRFLLDITRRACAGKQPVIWMNAFAPTEIVYGLRAVPVMPEIIASLVAYLGWSRRPIALADSEISTDLCSFYRCALGLVLEDYLPRPDLILSSSHLCDGANKFFHSLSEIYGCPHLMLDPPYTRNPHGHRYMVSQIKDLVVTACEILGVPLDLGHFASVLTLSNEARKYMAKVNVLRRCKPSPLPGRDGLSYVAGMNFSSLGSRWGSRFYQSLYHHVRGKVARGQGYLQREKRRLLWLHHIRPYYRNEIFQILDEHHVAVSFEEPNFLYWSYLEPSEPWESLAGKILSNVWAGPLERRVEAIRKMAEAYGIDGAIHFSHWGCRQACGGAGIIADDLKEKGIPCAVLPGDGADSDNYSPGQTRTRLEALVEMLE